MIPKPEDAPIKVLDSPMTIRLLSKRGRPAKGFTLIELLIVGALIALFAGLAIFGAQQAYLDNQRKAMIGESKQVAAALDMAYADVGFFPALAFMDKGLTNLFVTAQQEGVGANGEAILNFMHIYLLSTNGREQGIRRDWAASGYFSASQARSGVAQGRGGSRKAILQVPGGPNLGEWDWPLDAYGNPWMVYDLNVNRTTGALSFNLGDIFETGDFVTAVVSYGRNRVPGGGVLTEDPGAGTGLRLFTATNFNDPTAPITYPNPAIATNPALANAWQTGRPGFPGGGTGAFNLPQDIDSGDAIGITDPGSDDIVFTF